MKTFDVFFISDSKYKATKAKKNSYPSQSSPESFMAQVSAMSASDATRRMQAMVNSGNFDISKFHHAIKAVQIKKSGFANVDEVGIQNAIYCDFNGVLDDRDKNSNCNQWDADFRLPLVVDIDKLFKVVELAIKHSAKLVMTSLWRRDTNFNVLISRAFKQSENEKHVEFWKTHRRTIRKLCSDTTEQLRLRDEEIKLHIECNDITNCVVFEDEEVITNEINPIMIPYSGLTDEHIKTADLVFLNANV